ncbi:hypothetical protein QVD17_40867 [Tagetes erecta]|uniref:Uncharacterized protein n=1 Tax=Tagetes erecta TaxID=13708 RepID=A0AAD8JU93_TARER|nr:hypothetical protein QVD17_40867 [Tagetes erecta]
MNRKSTLHPEVTIRANIHTGGDWKHGINGDGQYVKHTSSHRISFSSLTVYANFLSKVKESFGFKPNDILEVRYLVPTETGTFGALITSEADYREFIEFARNYRPSDVTLFTDVLPRKITFVVNLHTGGEWASGINGNGKYINYTSSHMMHMSSLTTYGDFMLMIRESFEFQPNDLLEVRYLVPGSEENTESEENTTGILIENESHYPEFVDFALANRETGLHIFTDVLY